SSTNSSCPSCRDIRRDPEAVQPALPGPDRAGPAATTQTIRRSGSGQYQIRPAAVTSYCHWSTTSTDPIPLTPHPTHEVDGEGSPLGVREEVDPASLGR